jgi:hypothetical protein
LYREVSGDLAKATGPREVQGAANRTVHTRTFNGLALASLDGWLVEKKGCQRAAGSPGLRREKEE